MHRIIPEIDHELGHDDLEIELDEVMSAVDDEHHGWTAPMMESCGGCGCGGCGCGGCRCGGCGCGGCRCGGCGGCRGCR